MLAARSELCESVVATAAEFLSEATHFQLYLLSTYLHLFYF